MSNQLPAFCLQIGKKNGKTLKNNYPSSLCPTWKKSEVRKRKSGRHKKEANTIHPSTSPPKHTQINTQIQPIIKLTHLALGVEGESLESGMTLVF